MPISQIKISTDLFLTGLTIPHHKPRGKPSVWRKERQKQTHKWTRNAQRYNKYNILSEYEKTVVIKLHTFITESEKNLLIIQLTPSPVTNQRQQRKIIGQTSKAQRFQSAKRANNPPDDVPR
ncbi:hypothetical protein Tsp_02853 [Trichinella spiralis]|uniref:hypothetical protein n=1 Tax=Trichinella spiralis TaxID=6334 RepID=UPI0001EFC982|nr:hypothetical protein Tsp_02853 [Trichinella spiralis]